jgi:Holliday junction resolvasome RuvABC endonuclease subunit
MPPRSATIVGVDLSLRRAAACALPVDWDKRGWDLSAVHTIVTGSELADASDERSRIERLRHVARDLVDFIERNEACRVAIEQYAMGTGRQSHKHSVGEVGGAFKLKLLDHLDLVAEPVVASQARKTFAGRLPRAGVKDWIVEQVRRLGGSALGWSPDECDAFVVANHLYMLNGGVALTLV